MRHSKTETLYRDATIKREAVDQEARTVELAFSSEEPVERWGYIEILDHDPRSVKLARLADGGAVLVDHDRTDHVGVVESARIDKDRLGRAVVRFGKSQRADEIFSDVVDGIRSKISVGYRIYAGEEIKGKAGEPDTFRATDWEPLEVSVVAIPADASVGIGRNADTHETEEKRMTDKDKKPAQDEKTTAAPEEKTTERKAAAVATDTSAHDQMKAERERVAEILKAAAGQNVDSVAQRFIAEGRTAEDFRDLMTMKTTVDKPTTTSGDVRISMSMPSRHRSLKAFKAVGEESAYRAGMWARAAVFGDPDALRWCQDYGVRIMTGSTSGQSSVVPDEMILPIIDLREQYGIARQYAYMHPMATDTATVPRRKSGVTAYFLADRTTAITESDMAFDDVNLVAREVAALTRLSQSYANDAVIDLAEQLADEMAYAFAVKEDDCLFNGDGSSTYGGIYGIRPKIIDGNHTAGAIDATTATNTFAEIVNDDLVSLTGVLPEYPGINPRWFISKRGNALVFDALKAAAGGNTIENLANKPTRAYLGDEIVITQSMPTSTGDLENVAMIVYGDMSMGVTFGDRQGIEVQVLRERYAEYNQVGVKAVERMDIVAHGLGDTSNAGPIVALIGA